MEHKVIGRLEEQAILKEIVDSKKPEFVAVYGRRRIGKTYLIREVYKKHIVFEFSGAFDIEMEEQLLNFYNSFYEHTKSIKKIEVPKTWFEAFEMLGQLAKKQNEKKKKSIIFIDELPWLDTPRSKFIKALEYLWNSKLSKYDNIALVICGSAASWISKKLFRNVGGLHNRITKRIRLESFTLSETEAFCKHKKLNLNQYQISQLYMAFGGIPFYLNELKRGESTVQQINRICFNKNGLLNKEYDSLYKALFKNAETHIKIVEILASKPQGLSKVEIGEYGKMKMGGTIMKAMNELEECGFISFHQPVFNQKRNGVYRLIDLYTLFYLKFIVKANKGGENDFAKIAKTNAYKIWCGYSFENICMLHINQIKKALGISGIYSTASSWKFTGNQYYQAAQIDLVIDRDDYLINLCEIKYFNTEYTITKTYAKKLRERKGIFEAVNKSKKAVNNILISTYGAVRNEWFLEQIDREVLLEDLF